MRKLFLHFFLFVVTTIFLSAPLLEAQNKAAAKPLDGEVRHWGMNFNWMRDFTVGKHVIDVLNYDLSDPEDEKVTGFGLDWYITPTSSLSLIGSVGIGNDQSENTSGKQEFDATEFGAKISYNIYPLGVDDPVYFSLGPWASYISYSETQTNTPATGTETKDEYSASRFGVGVNASAYVKPWVDLNWEFYAGYNVGAFITPESTITQTSGGQSTETKGPSSFHLQDCGGFVGTRFYFNYQKSF